MLDLNFIRNSSEVVIKGLFKRHVKDADTLIKEIISIDENRRQTQKIKDDKQAEANKIAKEIGGLMKKGQKLEADEVKAKAKMLSDEAKSLNEKVSEIEKELFEKLVLLPNVPKDIVPDGNGEDDNVELERNGEIPKLSHEALPHWVLIKQYDLIDFELGNKITGAGFPVYTGRGARLQRALINFFLDEALEAGYLEIQPPILINKDSGFGTGQLPDKDGQMYYVNQDDLYLIPTAEVPITNIYRDVILDVDKLPIKNVGHTPCFRREAGSWGAHVRGLNRLHQFDKVEIVQIQHPQKSQESFDEMINHVKSILDKLGLPYRILNLCGADIGFTSAITYDFEVYSAAQKRWLEVSSVSNFETYQSNRLKLRFKDDDKKTKLLHTLNGSALALPRIVAAILENNQSAEGIKIPAVLHKYTGFDIIK